MRLFPPFQLFTEFWKSKNHGYKQFLHTRNKFIFILLYAKILKVKCSENQNEKYKNAKRMIICTNENIPLRVNNAHRYGQHVHPFYIAKYDFWAGFITMVSDQTREITT